MSPGTGNSPAHPLRTAPSPAAIHPIFPRRSAYTRFSDGTLYAACGGLELLPVVCTRQRQRRQITGCARQFAHPLQRIRPVPGRVLIDHRPVVCVLQIELFGEPDARRPALPRRRPPPGMLSCSTRNFFHSPLKQYSVGFSGFVFSTYRSCWSMPTIVNPNATSSLWPRAIPGSDGSPAPITFQPGATR